MVNSILSILFSRLNIAVEYLCYQKQWISMLEIKTTRNQAD